MGGSAFSLALASALFHENEKENSRGRSEFYPWRTTQTIDILFIGYTCLVLNALLGMILDIARKGRHFSLMVQVVLALFAFGLYAHIFSKSKIFEKKYMSKSQRFTIASE